MKIANDCPDDAQASATVAVRENGFQLMRLSKVNAVISHSVE